MPSLRAFSSVGGDGVRSGGGFRCFGGFRGGRHVFLFSGGGGAGGSKWADGGVLNERSKTLPPPLSPDWVPGYYWVPLGTSWVPTGYRLGTWVPGYLGTWVPGYHWVLLGTCRFPVSHRSHWVPLGTTGYTGAGSQACVPPRTR